ncbi:MAG: enoyl-CoA hydratase/isomerase family protein [Terriglobia bacterium]
MNYQTLTIKLDGEIATLTFNRPDKRNAMSPEMIRELMEALDEVESGPAKVLILTGAGRAFSAGMDLAALRALASATAAEESARLSREDSRRIAAMFRRIFDFPKVTIAAVNGPAIAGGCGIATFCDFTLASPEAKFGYTEVRIGFMPALVSVFLIRQIGEKRARDLLLTGRLIDAEEAHRAGMVNEVVPAEHLLERARELATQLLEVSPTSLVHTKQLLRDFNRAELDRELEVAIRANAGIRATADFREGLSSFLEKRKPAWTGQ